MMKNIIIIACCFPLFTLAQQGNLTYNQTQDIKFAEGYKTNTTIDSYTTQDGLTIGIGDTLTIGNAVINSKTIGNVVIKSKKYMLDDVFSYLVIGDTKGIKNKEFRPLPHNYSGSKVIVKSFYVTHEKFNGYKLWPNRKQMPLYVSIFVRNTKTKSLAKIFLHSRKTILDIEKALSSGEIINYNAHF